MPNRLKLVIALFTFGCVALPAGSARAQTITVDTSQKQQVIEGLGGFGPAKPWWYDGPYFDQAWLDKLDDLGVTIVRTQLYWDFESKAKVFDLSASSSNGKQLDYLKAVQAKGMKILATVWSPPVWMKLNPNNALAPYCQGECGGTLDPAHYQDFADFLVEYVKQMHAAGVDIYALNFANEPLFENPFESCVYTEQTYADVLKVVGAAFVKAGLTTKLFGPEHMGGADWNAGFFSKVLGDANAAKYLSFYAVHSYTDGVAPDYGSADGWTQLYAHASGAGKQLWMTETSDSDTTGWDKAFLMAKGLHLALRFGKISGWVYWYMAGDVMTTAPESAPTPLYYAFKQYYRYIRPGYVQVGSTTDDPAILPTAFASGNGLTVVLINNGTSAKSATVKLASGAVPTCDGYRTSSSENAVAIGKITGGSVSLPAQSITTLFAADTSGVKPDGGGTGGSTVVTSTGGKAGTGGAGGGTGGSTVSASGGTVADGTVADGAVAGSPGTSSTSGKSGCSCGLARIPSANAVPMLGFLLGLLAMRRRRP